MCGINGFNFEDKSKIDAMNSCLLHRGPDFAGTHIDQEVSLGHRLLSIRESTELSRQPFAMNPEWVLLFNGQIYNNKKLIEHIDAVNPALKYLDTYLLYKTIEKYGWNFIEHIQGMFAIALYNTKEKKLRLYRDQSGQKPIYYYLKGGTFIFSSEIKAILTHPVDKTVDTESLMVATSLGYIPGEKTLFQYIKKVSASGCVSFDIDKKTLQKNLFASNSTDYFSDSFETAFEQLVQEHLQSKQRVAINLSGGLDSSLLLHEMSKEGHSIHTYSTEFEDCNEKYNRDATLARRLASDYRADHQTITVSKQIYLKNFIESYKTIEEPNYNISLPVYLHTAKIEGIHGDKNRVILSGNGGDEIFGGYPYYEQSVEISKQQMFLTPWVFNMIKNYRNKTNYHFQNMDERWLYFKDFRKKHIQSFDQRVVIEHIHDSTDELISEYGQKHDPVYEMMLRDRFLWMSGENFIQADKLFMSQSLEVRSPLSYHPFREYADKKLSKNDYFESGTNKVFLRNLYKNKLPDYIVNRKDKTGWRSPIIDWYNTEYKTLFLDIIPNRDGPYIEWSKVHSYIASKEGWPGKHIHVYLSLALLAKEYTIEL
jgi:asparagine synthase (glutamine-hydrolysing)